MPLDNTQPSDLVHEVQYQWMQRVPHLHKGTCMLFTSVKIIGTNTGDEVVSISINKVCDWDTVEKICALLRDSATEELSFQITAISEDI